MKMTVISMEIPYPPIHGGRVDIWRRLKALSKLGVEIQLICWTKVDPEPENIASIQQHVSSFYPIVYRRNITALLRRAIDLVSYPLEVSSRILRGQDWRSLLATVEEFQPDVIMADHVHTGVVALPLSRKIGVPMIVRSHDIGHLHYRYLMKMAKGHRKILRFLSQNHLESYEKKVLRESLAFYDISSDDLAFWKEQGFTNGFHLPPLIDFLEDAETSQKQIGVCEPDRITYDVVFLGNLIAENNVVGVIWFLQYVLPLLKISFPDIKILIAGSNPSSQIKELCHDLREDVDLNINPSNAAQIYRMGKVLINPISVGTGVSIKSIDMLAAGKPIVSFPKGLAGLPEEVKKYFDVAQDASSFTASIAGYLKGRSYQKADRQLLDSYFGITAIQSFLSNLDHLLTQRQGTKK